MLLDAARRAHCATQLKRVLDAAWRQQRATMLEGTSYESEFSDLPEDAAQVLTGDFLASDEGVLIVDERGEEVQVCSHPILPRRYLSGLDDDLQRVELIYRKGGEWRSVLTTRRDISDRRRIIELSAQGVDVTSENAGWLVKYLATVEAKNETIPREPSCGRFGWVGDNQFSPYMDGMVFTGQDSYSDMARALHDRGTLDEYAEVVRPLYMAGGIPRIMLAASFAAPIVGMTGGLPFIVHLWGGTENGKTLSLMLAASAWGDPSRSAGLIHPFDATLVGMERLSECLHNLPVCLDELGVRSANNDTGQIIYMLTEGKGKPRGKPDGMRKTPTWATVFLTTGEHPLTTYNSRAGTINRTISIPCGAVGNNIYRDPQTLLDGITACYGHAGPIATEIMRSFGADIMREMVQNNTARLKAALPSGSTQKQLQAAAYLMTGDMLGQMAIFSDTITDDSTDWLTGILASEDDVNNLPRALEWISGWIVSNGRHFAPDVNSADGCDAWGFLRSDNRWAIVGSILRREMEREGYSYEAFLTDAAAAGAIQLDSNGKKTVACRLGRTTVRCVVLDQQAEEDEVKGWRKRLNEYRNA